MQTEKARATAQQLAKTGFPRAKKASELLKGSCLVVESADGIETGIEMVQDSEEICGQMTDEFLNDQEPAIVKAVDGTRKAFDLYFGIEEKPTSDAGDVNTALDREF